MTDDNLSLVERRLQQDVAAVDALGRGGVRVDLTAGPKAVVKALRESADRIGFESPIDAAAHVMRRLDELPAAELGDPIPAYHASAGETVRTGRARSLGADDEVLSISFERVAPMTPLATVTLSTLVEIWGDGTAYLADHGWPAPPSKPVHGFTGSPEELLDRARVDLADPEIPLRQSLLLLWGARIGAADLVGTPEQRLLVAEGAAVRREEIRGLLFRADRLASGPEEGWYAACLYRSMLENLFEGFLGAVTFALVKPEEIDGVDEQLKENLPENEEASPEAVPSGVPDGHWWWRAPFVRS
ncbi:hypothetical protein [Nocardiopsis sp. NPDC006938]|uniref:hypothetical protein n=1 Tax=Nocardiopsis sp. NPDC006938 TaxID=3364337 RepID=UPI00369287E6